MTITGMSVQAHAQRIANLERMNSAVKQVGRKHAFKNYMPGCVTYNLSEYPVRQSLAPTEYDTELLTKLAENGVELIQIHEEWNDALGRFGGSKFESYDPPGLCEFVNLVHSLGMKIIAYMSSSFFQRTDPDFNPDWESDRPPYQMTYGDYAICSPHHAGWRKYLLNRVDRALTEYGFDGLFNDDGYGAVERYQFEPAHEDLLGLLYSLVNQRGGVCKLHIGEWVDIPTDQKLYDYLWVGEGVDSVLEIPERSVTYAPYVVPCIDLRHVRSFDESSAYVSSIPFMQFPLRVDGRPMTGERVFAEDVRYFEPWSGDPEQVVARAVHEHYMKNPDGPYSYGWWDSAVPRPAARETWFQHLALYKPMVAEGSTAWIDIRESELFTDVLPSQLVASTFANERTYLTLANLGPDDAKVRTRDQWTDRVDAASGHEWSVDAGAVRFLVFDK